MKKNSICPSLPFSPNLEGGEGRKGREKKKERQRKRKMTAGQIFLRWRWPADQGGGVEEKKKREKGRGERIGSFLAGPFLSAAGGETKKKKGRMEKAPCFIKPANQMHGLARPAGFRGGKKKKKGGKGNATNTAPMLFYRGAPIAGEIGSATGKKEKGKGEAKRTYRSAVLEFCCQLCTPKANRSNLRGKKRKTRDE